MRLWSIHPSYLDTKGLVALWREGLLALSVLEGKTKGYKNHSQLTRFKETNDPVNYMKSYLLQVYNESTKRGFKFNHAKIKNSKAYSRIAVTDSQLRYEITHLKHKLIKRDQARYEEIQAIIDPRPNPLFKIVKGRIAKWERINDDEISHNTDTAI